MNPLLRKILLFFLALLPFFEGALPQHAVGQEPSPIKIGAIVSLTGDAARNGLNWLEGAQAAVHDLKANGQNVELIIEDDQTTSAKVATAFVKLAAMDKVSGIIGGTWDFLAETAYPYAKRYQVPFITPTNPVEILSSAAQSNPWIFTNGLSLTAEREVMARFLKTRKVKKAALVYINVPYGTSHADLVREISKELDISIVTDSQISYQGFQDGIKLAALKISRGSPDIVFVVLNYEGVDSLLRELEHVHASPTVLMTHTLKEAFEFGASPQRYQKAFGIFPKFFSPNFEQLFSKKFGRLPYDYAAAGYDATRFLVSLIQAKGNLDIQDVKLKYDGITGLHQVPSMNRAVVQTEAILMNIENGSLVHSQF